MLNEIEKIIEENIREFSVDEEKFSYKTIKRKREELISLGMKLGCRFEAFKKVYTNIATTEKYSSFSLSCWGYYSPSILDDYHIVNVKRPKRLFTKPPKNIDGTYYQYLYVHQQLVMINYFSQNKLFRSKYICKVGNRIYSFTFPDIWENQIYIYEAVYDDAGNILTFSHIETYGMPENETNERILRHCRKGIRAALLDYQKYHYNDNGVLEYADKYSRIYDFSPQIVGLKLGKRFRFVYDDEGKRVGIKYDESAVPCIFKLD